MIPNEKWRKIHRLRNRGYSLREIAELCDCAKGTVQRALRGEPEQQRYSPRQVTSNAFAKVEAQVTELIEANPAIKATELARLVGWEGSMSWFRENVRPIRRAIKARQEYEEFKKRRIITFRSTMPEVRAPQELWPLP